MITGIDGILNAMEEIEEPKRPFNWKVYVGVAVFVLLVLGAIYLYWWFSNNAKMINEAQQVINRQIDYEQTWAQINDEKSRCESFVSKGEGEFGEFEYCKRFLEWNSRMPG